MVDFEEMLNNLISVEKAGFNPYTQAYSAILEPNGTTTPSTQESGLNTAQNASTEVTEVPTTTTSASTDQKQAYYDAWNAYAPQQAAITRLFQETYPNIPVQEILSEYSKMEGFSNKQLDKYFADLEKKYGKASLTPEQVKSVAPEFYQTQSVLRQGDVVVPEKDKRASISTRGEEEQNIEELWSYRNLLERRQGVGQKVPYLYLEDFKEITDEGDIVEEVKEKTKKK